LELKAEIRAVPIKEEHKLPDILMNLAKECFEMLNEYAGVLSSKVNDKTEVSWGVFKNITLICKKKIDFTGEYIDHYICQK